MRAFRVGDTYNDGPKHAFVILSSDEETTRYTAEDFIFSGRPVWVNTLHTKRLRKLEEEGKFNLVSRATKLLSFRRVCERSSSR